MTEQEIQDNIDDYLLNKMSVAEKAAFENQLDNDGELKQKVTLQKILVDEMLYQKEFKRITQRKKVMPFAFKQTMVIAWSAAAIFIGVFFINRTVVNKRMDNLYSLNLSIPTYDEVRGEQDVQLKEFQNAIFYLKNHQPNQAKDALLKLYAKPKDYPYYDAVRWYLALTELKLHNKSEAKKYLNELVDSEVYGGKANKILGKL